MCVMKLNLYVPKALKHLQIALPVVVTASHHELVAGCGADFEAPNGLSGAEVQRIVPRCAVGRPH